MEKKYLKPEIVVLELDVKLNVLTASGDSVNVGEFGDFAGGNIWQ